MKALNNIQAYNKKFMFKGYKKAFNYLLGLFDVALSVALLYISFYVINYHELNEGYSFSIKHYFFLAFLIPTLILLLQTTNISRIPRTSRYSSLFFDFVRFTIALFPFVVLFAMVLKMEMLSLSVILLYLTLNILVLYIVRIITFRFFKLYRLTGHNFRNVIVIADKYSEPIIEKILKNKELGFRILFIVTNSKEIKKRYLGKIKILPDKVNLKKILDVDIIDEVIYSKSEIDRESLTNVVNACEEVGVVFRLQNDLSPIKYRRGTLTHLEEIPMLTIMNTPSNQLALAWKTLTESIFAFLTLFFVSPLLLLIVILIKLDSKGPAIFKQKRVGLRGRQFYIYKFRTMVVNAEELRIKLEEQNEADGPTFKIKQDPRITRIGRFLRKTSLDEVPQLFNVLRGEMSLIGPRPPLPKEVVEYERWQLRRLSVKPGITCTWQIIPNRNDVLFEKWMKLDLNYIDNWSLRNDVGLVFKTIKSVFTNSGY